MVQSDSIGERVERGVRFFLKAVLWACVGVLVASSAPRAQETSAPGHSVVEGKPASTSDSFPSVGEEGGVPREAPIGYEFDDIDRLKGQPTEPLGPPPAAADDLGALLQEPQPAAPGRVTHFAGIGATGWIPPDPILAAGPNHLVAAVNSSWAIFTKAGSKQFQATLTSWFSSVLPAGVNPFDPKVIYDQHSSRWILLAVATKSSTQQAWYLLSTSDDSDPNGTWCRWALDATLDGATPSTNWADYPGLGLDNTAIYLTSNQFSFPGAFQYVKLRTLGKAQLYNNTCGPVNWWDFTNLTNTDGTKAFTVQPAHTFGTPGVEYLINSRSGSGNSVTLWSLTNPLGAPPTLTKVNVPVSSYSLPPDAQQPGGATRIDTGDARLMNVVYRNGSVYTAHAIAWNMATESRARYLRIDPTGPTVTLDEAFGTPGFFYYYPVVMVDGSGNIVTVFNRSSVSEFAGIRWTGRKLGDAAFQPSAQLKAGVASYVALDSIGRNRWGDYNGIALDPNDSKQVWIFSEYVAAANTWGTWIGSVGFADLGIVTNGASFGTGGTLNWDVVVGAGPWGVVDVYLAVVLPNGSFICMTPGGGFGPLNVPVALALGWSPVPGTYRVLSYTFAGAEPAGNYQLFAIFANAGQDVLDPGNWGAFESKPFSFAP